MDRLLGRGVTLLAVDRPGYGQSDPVPDSSWASVGSAADDLAAVLDRAACAPVGVAGWSAGRRVALALAVRRPDLVDRVVVLGTPAPHEQVPWIPPEQQAALDVLRGVAPDAARAALSQQLAPLIPRDTRAADALSMLAASAADDTALALPHARARLATMLAAAFAQGIAGLASDIAGYCLHPWGFAPEAVQAKTLLPYGSKDPVAGSRHGTWWRKHLPNARLEVVPGAGHLLILSIWARALASRARQQATGLSARLSALRFGKYHPFCCICGRTAYRHISALPMCAHDRSRSCRHRSRSCRYRSCRRHDASAAANI